MKCGGGGIVDGEKCCQWCLLLLEYVAQQRTDMKTRFNYLTEKTNIQRISLAVWRYMYAQQREDFAKLGVSEPELCEEGSEAELAQYAMLADRLQCIPGDAGVSDFFMESIQTLEQMLEHDSPELRRFVENCNEEEELEAYFYGECPEAAGKALSHAELAIVMWYHPKELWKKLVGYILYMIKDRTAMSCYALTECSVKTNRPEELDLEALRTAFQQAFAEKGEPSAYCEVERMLLCGADDDEAEEEYCFTIAHADRPVRCNKVEGSGVERFSFRPPKTEIVVYNTATRSLRMNTELVGMSNMITGIFSKALTDGRRTQIFRKAQVYTFAPVEEGKMYLQTHGVEGLSMVKLHMLEEQVTDEEGEFCIHSYRASKGGDIRRAAGYGKSKPKGSIRKMEVELLFNGDRKPTKLRIIGAYKLSVDKQRRYKAELWLQLGGFVVDMA